MGTPIFPNPPGSPCSLCWGPGKAFGDVPTPRYIVMSLLGLQPGDDWDPAHEQLLLLPHTLDQAITPCDWDIKDGTFTWSFGYTSTGTTVRVVRDSDSRTAFLANTPHLCQTTIPNALNDPFGVIAYNGTANVSLAQVILP